MTGEKIIISLGGSLVVPDNIDTNFLKSFKELILSHVGRGKQFVIIVGGGKICRRYQEAAKDLTPTANVDLDWIGIASIKLNAELLRVIFGEFAEDKVVDNLATPLVFKKPIIIGAAYEPGHSSDFDAMLAAKSVGATKLVNLSNTDYVYDSDPKKNPVAQKIEKISWADFRKLIPKEWHPGLNTPFDPIASAEAEGSGIEVAIMNGKPIENLANYLNNIKFQGTIIS